MQNADARERLSNHAKYAIIYKYNIEQHRIKSVCLRDNQFFVKENKKRRNTLGIHEDFVIYDEKDASR